MSWSRALRAQAALTGCVIVAAATAAIVGGGPAATPLAAGRIIALMRNAPLALSAYPSMTMRMTTNLDINGRSISVVATGVATPDGRRGILTEQLPGSLGVLRLTVVAPDLYGRVAPSHYAETNGKQWAELRVTGPSTAQLAPSSVTAYLQLLAGVGKVQDKGPSTIDGTRVEHYHVDIDVAKALAQVPSQLRTTSAEQMQALGVTTMPMDVWLTDVGLPVQLKFSVKAPGASVSAKFAIRLHGSNDPVTVSAPPADEVYVVTNAADLGRLLVN
jgi:hypothetical protein